MKNITRNRFMKKILLTGSEGQLGQSIIKINSLNPEYTIVPTDLRELDITQAKEVHRFLQSEPFDLVINAAAYTQVDGAETDYETALRVNGTAPGILAAACRETDTGLIHISTDYVFDGNLDRDYQEADAANPINAYGRSKLAGEQAIARAGAKALIIRTSWLFSETGKNFVKTMLALAQEGKPLRIINDQYGSPTYAGHLAEALLFLAGKRFHPGISLFHITNKGFTTWYHLAMKVFATAGIRAAVTPVPSTGFKTAAARPARSVLSNQRLETVTGYVMPAWETGVETCLREIERLNSIH
ncbi:MAG: dTDP-4-dehydrorhamnose reductase [Bacteroidales bacterium]|nr:dTDP-4-dehydrorhamnose reductase [Bacteroidales bacterium]